MTDEAVAPDRPPAPGGSGSVRLVGTAHVSSESVEEVERVIDEERPDVVAVELDEGRYRQLKGEAPEDLEASDLLRGNTVFQFLAYWMLSYLQTRLGERFDVQPGADMLAAIETAEDHDLGVALVDRDIQTTVQRFWARLGLREKGALIASLAAEMGDPRVTATSIAMSIGLVVGVAAETITGPLVLSGGSWLGFTVPFVGGVGVALADGAIVAALVSAVIWIPTVFILTRARADEDADVAEFDVEDLTDTDVVTAMLEEFRRFSPGGAEALIDERDAFIAHRLVELRDAGYDVVAVVGAGHEAGIEGYLDDPSTLPPMETLIGTADGGRFSLYKAVGYLITLSFLAFFVLLALAGVSDVFLLTVFATWFVINAVVAGGLARLAGAHWQSAATGGAVAWLTSVNPLLAPGWFAGYVELRYLTVNVGDISTLNEILADETAPMEDIFRRMREVPLFRLILIVAMTNIGSMIASFAFAAFLIPVFGQGVTCQTTTMFGPVGGVGCQLVQGARQGASMLAGLVS